MKRPKFYSKDDGETCQQIEYFHEYLEDFNLKELEITEMKRDVGGQFFYCAEHGGVGEKSEGGCGWICKEYKPRNKKSGICEHNRNCYTKTNNKILLINPNYDPSN